MMGVLMTQCAQHISCLFSHTRQCRGQNSWLAPPHEAADGDSPYSRDFLGSYHPAYPATMLSMCLPHTLLHTAWGTGVQLC